MGDVYAIIPAKSNNEELHNRNLREIKGVPLVGIAVRQALNSEKIDHVVVNTESEEISDVAENYGAEVSDRPSRFTKSDRFMEVDRLLAWQLDQLESDGADIDAIVLLYPTCPLRTINIIDRAVEKVADEGYDSALTLYEDNRYLWKREEDQVTPTNYDPQKRAPHQIEEWNQWVENKAVYVMSRETLLRTGCRLGGEIGFVEMPVHRSISIDTPVDFKLAQFISEVDGASW
ncbi:N-acylneuraminate cytidylyltransferase [Haloferax larsenii JCM 13917]|nr:acylneuraminate cytidylyltransferase family protein [Haloferax larsenii]ELZ81336.1 N-acylneuraminate cytidylyltransferase [Haloferax larsenii JCM 13917]